MHYKGGGPAATAVISGETQVCFSNTIADALPQQVAGGLQILRQCPLRRLDARHQEPVRHRIGHRTSSLWPARHSRRRSQSGGKTIDPGTEPVNRFETLADANLL